MPRNRAPLLALLLFPAARRTPGPRPPGPLLLRSASRVARFDRDRGITLLALVLVLVLVLLLVLLLLFLDDDDDDDDEVALAPAADGLPEGPRAALLGASLRPRAPPPPPPLPPPRTSTASLD